MVRQRIFLTLIGDNYIWINETRGKSVRAKTHFPLNQSRARKSLISSTIKSTKSFLFFRSILSSSRTKMILRRRTEAPNPHSFAEEVSDYEDACCQKCGSGDFPAEMLLCDKCDKGFHLFCLTPIIVSVPKGSWFCSRCSNHKMPKCIFSSSLLHFKSFIHWIMGFSFRWFRFYELIFISYLIFVKIRLVYLLQDTRMGFTVSFFFFFSFDYWF